MRRILILVAVLAGCADDAPNAHDDSSCDATWAPTATCDLACKVKPAQTTPGGCRYTNNVVQPPVGQTCPNGQQVDFDGAPGCCVPLLKTPNQVDEDRIIFFECE